jgi:hypothetical protein
VTRAKSATQAEAGPRNVSDICVTSERLCQSAGGAQRHDLGDCVSGARKNRTYDLSILSAKPSIVRGRIRKFLRHCREVHRPQSTLSDKRRNLRSGKTFVQCRLAPSCAARL